jgi:hypothetical protein
MMPKAAKGFFARHPATSRNLPMEVVLVGVILVLLLTNKLIDNN